MQIILGQWLDANAYPDALGKEDASIGNIVTGFHGLVGILETQLGLTAPQVSDNIRISVWQELIRSIDTGDLPFSKSFETDSWNTAKELLHRRDELIIAGWNPTEHIGGGKWIEVLAELELANEQQVPGLADRVQIMMKKLQEHHTTLSIQQITIVDDDINLWDPWARQLVALLEERGVEIIHETQQITEKLHSDLAVLQSVLAGDESPSEATGDNSLLLVQAEQELDAADFLATWLQQYETDNTLLIKGEGSLLLDEVLHRRGVPAIGVDTSSKWRAVLQVLPLTIDTYWEPVRIERMLELLTIPASPVPARIRFRLANALSNNPGIGGELWTSAIEEGIASYEKAWLEEGLDEREIKKRRKNLDEKLALWVNHEFYHPEDGIPFDKLAEVCQKVGHWARTHFHTTNDVMYMQAAQIADEVFEGMKTLGVNKVSHLQVARILDSVIGSGATLSTYVEEATNWEVVNHPGQIWRDAETIVWWGFNKNTSDASTRIWTSKERAWLKEQGIELIAEDIRRQREAATWQQAVKFANKRLILIAPSRVRGEEVPIHPLWDEIRFAVANEYETIQKITIDAADLKKQASHPLFGAEAIRTVQSLRKLPAPMTSWKVPEKFMKRRKEESATSFESLIGCPLQWTFKYVAKIRPGNIVSLPNDSLMLGNLGHTILEQLILEKPNWGEHEVRRRVGELFDELTPELAATLLEPQNQIEWSRTRRNLQQSIQQFFKVLHDAGITIDSTEEELQKPWNDDVNFKGRLDLIGTTRSGNKMFIDAKWSRSPANYKKRLENLSVQLSLYHWLLVDHEDDDLPVAYFMLRTGEFYSLTHDDFPTDYHVEGPSLTDSFKVVREAVEDVWTQLEEGNVVATGVLAEVEADGETFSQIIDPPCRFCEYQNLCGVRRVAQ